MSHSLFAIAGLVSLLVGCTSAGSIDPGSSSSVPSSAPAATDPKLVAVVADAAKRLAVEPAQIAVVSVEATTWSDGSLGCPEEGMLYTQALVEGHRVLVSANGTALDYRVTGPGAFRLCENQASAGP